MKDITSLIGMAVYDIPKENYATPDLIVIGGYMGLDSTSAFGITLDDIDVDGPFISIPGTAIEYAPRAGIYQDIAATGEFCRLDGIQQLGSSGADGHNALFHQTRYFHSIVTAMLADIVLYRNHCSEHDRKLGIAAGLTHDLAMMPYSDQGKLMKPGSYDEENLVEYVMRKSPKWTGIFEKHGLTLAEVVAAIQGKGVVGQLLNSREGLDIDNLAYLATDQAAVKNWGDPERDAIKEIPGIFNQYQSLELMPGNQWVFADPAMLAQLLTFRALMYERTYCNPFTRAKEAFLEAILREKAVPLDDLLRWTDHDFVVWFKGAVDPDIAGTFFDFQNPYVEIGREYDLSKLDELKRSKEREGVIVSHPHYPRAATKNLVMYEGEIRKLEEIPEFAEDIARVKSIIEGMNYIGIDGTAQSPEPGLAAFSVGPRRSGHSC